MSAYYRVNIVSGDAQLLHQTAAEEGVLHSALSPDGKTIVYLESPGQPVSSTSTAVAKHDCHRLAAQCSRLASSPSRPPSSRSLASLPCRPTACRLPIETQIR